MIKETTKQRDAELRKRFDELRNSGVNSKYYNWKDIVRLLAKMPAPRFYISPKMAEQYVFNFKRGTFLLKSNEGKAMIRDLVENYDRIKMESPNKLAYEIWDELVDSPAKSFYLKEKTIRYIIYEYLRPTANRSVKRRV